MSNKPIDEGVECVDVEDDRKNKIKCARCKDEEFDLEPIKNFICSECIHETPILLDNNRPHRLEEKRCSGCNIWMKDLEYRLNFSSLTVYLCDRCVIITRDAILAITQSGCW